VRLQGRSLLRRPGAVLQTSPPSLDRSRGRVHTPYGVSVFGIWVSGFGFRGLDQHESRSDAEPAMLRRDLIYSSGFRVSSFGFRIAGPGFRFRGFLVSGFWVRVSVFGFQMPGFRFRVSCFLFRVSGFAFVVCGLWFGVSGFTFRVSGVTFRVAGLGQTATLETSGREQYN